MEPQHGDSEGSSHFLRSFSGPAVRLGHWARSSPLAVDILIAAGLAAVGVPLTVWALLADGSDAAMVGTPSAEGGWLVVTLVAVALGHGALAARRVRPLISCLIVVTMVAVQTLTTPWVLLPSMFVALPSLYSVAAYGRGNGPSTALGRIPVGPAVGLVLAVIGTLLAAGTAQTIAASPGIDAVDYGLRLLPGVLVAWSLGLLRRSRMAYAARVAELERTQRVREAVTEQRNQIAREMHDVIAHALSVVISQANGGRYAARGNPDRAVEILETIAHTGQQALADTRGMLSMLRAGQPEGSAPPAVPPSLDDLPDLVARFRSSGILVKLEHEGRRRAIGPAAELATYRLVQEALTNTLKHAGSNASSVVRLVWYGDGLIVTVTDDGPGPPDRGTPADGWSGGQGLLGMRERVAAVSGSTSTGAGPDGGFRVQAWIPDPGKGEP